VDGAGKRAEIEGRVKQIRAQIEDTTSTTIARSCRSGWPRWWAGRGHQGGRGHRDRDEGEKGRVEDALHATRAAVEEGIVAGGGVALIRAVASMEKLDKPSEEQAVAWPSSRAPARSPAA